MNQRAPIGLNSSATQRGIATASIFLKALACFLLLGIAFLAVPVFSQTPPPAPVPLPPMDVTGRRIPAVCYSAACVTAILDAQASADRQYMKFLKSQNRDNIGDMPTLTKEQICTVIKSKQPPNCTAKPTIAGINGPANGCGSGTGSRIFGTLGLELKHPLSFTGNIDAPIQGVSFLSACNAHDFCYAAQKDKDVCDRGFNTDLTAACSRAVDNTICQSFANDYTAAVNNLGGDAYAVSGRELACYKYQKEVEDNGCK